MIEEKTEVEETPVEASEPATEENHDSRRVKIVRVGDEPATCISYEDGSGTMQQWRSDPAKKTFQVPAIIAAACVASGYFEQAKDSKTKLV